MPEQSQKSPVIPDQEWWQALGLIVAVFVSLIYVATHGDQVRAVLHFLHLD